MSYTPCGTINLVMKHILVYLLYIKTIQLNEKVFSWASMDIYISIRLRCNHIYTHHGKLHITLQVLGRYHLYTWIDRHRQSVLYAIFSISPAYEFPPSVEHHVGQPVKYQLSFVVIVLWLTTACDNIST